MNTLITPSPHSTYQKITKRVLLSVVAVAAIFIGVFLFQANAKADEITHSSDFETDTSGWNDAAAITRVPSGTNAIASSQGNYHAIVNKTANSNTPATNLGGYSSTWTGDWTSTIDVYLDPSWAAGEAFAYSVAANNTQGAYLQDYLLHAGVLNDGSTGNTNKLLVIADTLTGSEDDILYQIKATPADKRAEITTAGWYTIRHDFKNLDGKLAVQVSLLSSTGTTVFTRELSSTGVDESIPSNVGGNRYGWFYDITIPGGVSIDNVTKTVRGNTYTVQSDATAPASVVLGDNQTMTIQGATGGAVTVPVNLTVKSSANNAQVVIPAGTAISADDAAWKGTVNALAIQSLDSVVVNDKAEAVSYAVKVGASTPLSFSKPVKVILPGQAGKKAGYIDATDTFHAITTSCGDNPSAALTGTVNECFTASGNDLVIWTNHFTTFIAYGQVADNGALAPSAPDSGLSSLKVSPLAIIGAVSLVLTFGAVAVLARRK